MNVKKLAIVSIATALLMTGASAQAKCTLTVKFNNNDTHEIVVLGSESRVRVNGGIWFKMRFDNLTIAPGGSGSSSWRTNMSCGGSAKRDFRVKFQDDSDNVIYLNTKINDIDIYDGQQLTWRLETH